MQQLDEHVASVDVIAPLAWDYGAQDLVEANMRSTGIDDAHLRFVKGRVEQTLRSGLATGDLPAKIAFLRLDTDFYDSTKAELEVLWPRLVRGGLLIVDDYYAWRGARLAVDEWLIAQSPEWTNLTQARLRSFHHNWKAPGQYKTFALWKEPPFVRDPSPDERFRFTNCKLS